MPDRELVGLVALFSNEVVRPFTTAHQVAMAIVSNQAAAALVSVRRAERKLKS